MIHSIRLRLFAGVSLLIIFFVLFSWVLNTNYLERYYLSQKTNELKKQAAYIDGLYENQPADLVFDLELLERSRTLNILILNRNFDLIYATLSRRPRPYRVEIVVDRLRELEMTGQLVEITGDLFNNTRSLNLFHRLTDGNYLIISTPLAPIEESAAIANKFFLYTGIITLGLATLVVFAFARRFTQPIVELNDIAQSMARLDFAKKYRGRTQDELGELGDNINSLSEQLSKAISELQEANARLREDIERERHIDEMRKEFVSNVSHELKTPIALIQGYAEGLKVNVVEDEAEKAFYCSVIMDEANKMNKLVKELLDLSQVESGIFRLEKSPFDLSALLENIIAKYKPIFEEKEVQLQVIKPESLVVNADIIRSEQIITNYINNALNHIDQQRVLSINIERQDCKAHIRVFNSGDHIPGEALEKIFTSFYKLDRARSRTDRGYGLGLAVVRAIQERDQNRYGVQNLPGGVEFWFELDLDTGVD